MHKIIHLISIVQKHVPFYESTCSFGEFDEKPNHTKNSKKRVARQRTHFFNHLVKTLCLIGSKCLALGANHMCNK
jgi:hypothetical protein